MLNKINIINPCIPNLFYVDTEIKYLILEDIKGAVPIVINNKSSVIWQ